MLFHISSFISFHNQKSVHSISNAKRKTGIWQVYYMCIRIWSYTHTQFSFVRKNGQKRAEKSLTLKKTSRQLFKRKKTVFYIHKIEDEEKVFQDCSFIHSFNTIHIKWSQMRSVKKKEEKDSRCVQMARQTRFIFFGSWKKMYN